MRYLIPVFAFMLSNSAAAQVMTCDSVVTVQDKFTSKTVTQFSNLYHLTSSSGALWLFDAIHHHEARLYRLYVVVQDVGCIDDDGAAIFVFTNGNKYTVWNAGDFDCDGIFSVDLKANRKFTADLFSAELEAIRINGMSRTQETEIHPTDGTELTILLKCFADKSGLLK